MIHQASIKSHRSSLINQALDNYAVATGLTLLSIESFEREHFPLAHVHFLTGIAPVHRRCH
jgi:hypothetical protein